MPKLSSTSTGKSLKFLNHPSIRAPFCSFNNGNDSHTECFPGPKATKASTYWTENELGLQRFFKVLFQSLKGSSSELVCCVNVGIIGKIVAFCLLLLVEMVVTTMDIR
jgi:hypothetical protein